MSLDLQLVLDEVQRVKDLPDQGVETKTTLARLLAVVALGYEESEDRTAAITTGNEAIEIFRWLNARDKGLQVELAQALQTVAINQSAIDDHSAALKANNEAIELLRAFVGQSVNAQLLSDAKALLATALNNAGDNSSALGDYAEASTFLTQSVEIKRELAIADPDQNSSEFAQALNNLEIAMLASDSSDGYQKVWQQTMDEPRLSPACRSELMAARAYLRCMMASQGVATPEAANDLLSLIVSLIESSLETVKDEALLDLPARKTRGILRKLAAFSREAGVKNLPTWMTELSAEVDYRPNSVLLMHQIKPVIHLIQGDLMTQQSWHINITV